MSIGWLEPYRYHRCVFLRMFPSLGLYHEVKGEEARIFTAPKFEAHVGHEVAKKWKVTFKVDEDSHWRSRPLLSLFQRVAAYLETSGVGGKRIKVYDPAQAAWKAGEIQAGVVDGCYHQVKFDVGGTEKLQLVSEWIEFEDEESKLRPDVALASVLSTVDEENPPKRARVAKMENDENEEVGGSGHLDSSNTNYKHML
ncbi:hypothetical protein CYMTET_35214, partial [Cymbomonas tetramitiformis]